MDEKLSSTCPLNLLLSYVTDFSLKSGPKVDRKILYSLSNQCSGYCNKYADTSVHRTVSDNRLLNNFTVPVIILDTATELNRL